MQRVGHTVDEHDPVFSGHAVGSVRIEIFDRQRIAGGQGCGSFGQTVRRRYPEQNVGRCDSQVRAATMGTRRIGLG